MDTNKHEETHVDKKQFFFLQRDKTHLEVDQPVERRVLAGPRVRVQEDLPLVHELEVSSLPRLADEHVAHVVLVPQGGGREGEQVARLLGETTGKRGREGGMEKSRVKLRLTRIFFTTSDMRYK